MLRGKIDNEKTLLSDWILVVRVIENTQILCAGTHEHSHTQTPAVTQLSNCHMNLKKAKTLYINDAIVKYVLFKYLLHYNIRFLDILCDPIYMSNDLTCFPHPKVDKL